MNALLHAQRGLFVLCILLDNGLQRLLLFDALLLLQLLTRLPDLVLRGMKRGLQLALAHRHVALQCHFFRAQSLQFRRVLRLFLAQQRAHLPPVVTFLLLHF